MAYEQTQISTPELAGVFEFLSEITEDEYYILHYIVSPQPALIIADTHGGVILTIQHPEQIYMLQPLLTLLLDEGVPVSGQAEVILAVTGEQILSLLG